MRKEGEMEKTLLQGDTSARRGSNKKVFLTDLGTWRRRPHMSGNDPVALWTTVESMPESGQPKGIATSGGDHTETGKPHKGQ